MKIDINFLQKYKIKAFGFQALKELESLSNPDGMEIVVSSLSPAIMQDMGISLYYAPVLPRNMVFNTAQDVLDANLDLQQVSVMYYPSWDLINDGKIVIVSRHKGTIQILKQMYPDAPVLSGNVTKDDIDRCHVIGTLPPHLIQHCQSYKAVTVKNFDYTKDGDLQGEELLNRLVISVPITIVIKEV